MEDSLNKYLLDAYYIKATFPGIRYAAVTRQKSPPSWKLYRINKINK
jgi:hypothetical protein